MHTLWSVVSQLLAFVPPNTHSCLPKGKQSPRPDLQDDSHLEDWVWICCLFPGTFVPEKLAVRSSWSQRMHGCERVCSRLFQCQLFDFTGHILVFFWGNAWVWHDRRATISSNLGNSEYMQRRTVPVDSIFSFLIETSDILYQDSMVLLLACPSPPPPPPTLTQKQRGGGGGTDFPFFATTVGRSQRWQNVISHELAKTYVLGCAY